MSEPRGNIVTPVAENPSDVVRGFELDANDYLLVAVASMPEVESDSNVFDGTNWQKQAGDTAGKAYALPIPHAIHDVTGVTQVLKSAVATNQTSVIHTVTAGKTFYLTSLRVFSSTTNAARTNTRLRFRNNAAATIAEYIQRVLVTESLETSLSFNPPLELLASYDVVVISPDANTVVDGVVTGYEL